MNSKSISSYIDGDVQEDMVLVRLSEFIQYLEHALSYSHPGINTNRACRQWMQIAKY